MFDDDPDEDEDWYDDDDEPDEEQPTRCPECASPVYSVSDRCPACGHWLSETDRRGMWSGESKPTWTKITTLIVLVVLLLGLLGIGSAFF